MKTFISKITSRKLWLAIAGVATGICMVLGVDSGEITQVAGGVVALLSAVIYIVTEGKVDAERIKNAVLGVQSATDALKGGEDN